MIDRESVIRHCVTAVNNHADDVRDTLNACLAAETPEALRFATSRLRDVLVALAAGHERGCGNGSTFKARVEAAKMALAAWDGAPSHAHEEDAAPAAPVAKGRLRGV